MKTIEEKRSAVLARCLEVCKDGAQPEFYWGSLWMRDGKPMYRLKIRSVMSMSGYVENEPDSTIHLLYSVMGLEARDAVEAAGKASRQMLEATIQGANKEIERLRQLLPSAQEARQIIGLANQTIEELRSSLNASEAYNTVLEEALEAIIYQDEVNGKGWENDSNSTYSRLCRALAAHKKGGTGE